jgi:hypothetical protein
VSSSKYQQKMGLTRIWGISGAGSAGQAEAKGDGKGNGKSKRQAGRKDR